jgi:hypothetical protein
LNVPDDNQPCHLHGKLFSGRMMMNTGVELALNGEYASRVFLLEVQ